MTKYEPLTFNHNELDELMNKDNGLLKYKFEEYGKRWLVEQMTEKVTKRQRAAWLALKDVMVLESKNIPFNLIVKKAGIEVRLK